MTPRKFKEIAIAMNEFGLSHVKMGDVELWRDSLAAKVLVPEAKDAISDGSIPSLATDDPIKHKVEQLTSLLKLGDTELVDQLFPDHTEELA